MALYELNCYGENDEIVKKFETERLRYGVFEEAVKVAEEIEKVAPADRYMTAGRYIKPFIEAIFPWADPKDLRLADVKDMTNLMYQVIGNKAAPLTEAAADGDPDSKN